VESQVIHYSYDVDRYVESHFSEHLERLKEIVRIPSIAADNPEGVQRCARLVQHWFKELGCAESEILETNGSPVVYGHYDAHAKNTLLIYMMYDVKQVQGENWTLIKNPFEPQLMPLAPFKSVLVGRGTFNSKGSLTLFLNTLFALKAVGRELPVNLKFIAEGEEELGSQHLIDFVRENRNKLSDGSACFAPVCAQNIDGTPSMNLGCKGVVELELECSGEYWGRGPTKRGIHSSLAATVESPIWRMISALSTMVDQRDPSKVLIEGFYDNIAKPSPRDLQLVDELAKVYDENALKKSTDVQHFVHDLHGKELLMRALYNTTLNIQGINGGYTGPKFKTVLPHNVKAKLESRILPNQTRTETVENVRKHLDKHGYSDIKVVDSAAESSDDWSRTNPDAGIAKVVKRSYEDWGYKPQVWPFNLGTSPQYIFTKHLGIPYIAAGLGFGARAHAPDEYYVIEGDGKMDGVAGLVETERFFVHLLYGMGTARLG